MKKIGKKDLMTLKSALKYVEEHQSEGHICEKCPMSKKNNRAKVGCYLFIMKIGGDKIYEESGGDCTGCRDQVIAIKYMVNHSKYRLGCKI